MALPHPICSRSLPQSCDSFTVGNGWTLLTRPDAPTEILETTHGLRSNASLNNRVGAQPSHSDTKVTQMTSQPPTINAEVVQVADNAYAYVQDDGSWFINNTGFVIGPDGVILIDTSSTEARTRAFLDAVAVITDAPIHAVVNTHHHGDHTHGNYLTAPAPIISHRLCKDIVEKAGIDHYPTVFEQPNWGNLELRAPTITFKTRMDLWAGDTIVELHTMGDVAHTTNDVVAWLPTEGVLYTGDLVFHGGTPFVLMGSVQGSIDALDVLRGFGAETVVPGHGKVTGPQVFDDIERYLSMILDVATAAHSAGKTPLDAARGVELGDFASLTDSERLVGNLYRAMAEIDGPEANANMSIAAAIGDMITFHGGPLLPCSA